MITSKEAMAIWGLTSRTEFWKIVYTRNIPHYRVPGTRVIRFERAEIEAEKRSWRITAPEDLRKAINGRRLS